MNFKIKRRSCLKAALAGTALAAGLPAWPQTTPRGVLYGFAPGSGVFPVMSALLKELHGRYLPDLGTKMTYMPGNVGARAMEAVLKSAADGGTLLASPSGIFTLVPQFRRMSDVDPFVDMVPVVAFAESTVVLVVGPLVPASVKTVRELVDWLSENPLQASYGVPGMGTEGHLLGIGIAAATSTSFKPMAYKGEAPLVQDMRDSALAFGFVSIGTSASADALRDGSLRRLAVCSTQRWPAAPSLPTLKELGLADVGVDASFGFFASARTPAAKLDELREAVTLALASVAVNAAVAEVMMRPVSAAQSNYPAAIARERAGWASHIAKHRLTLDS